MGSKTILLSFSHTWWSHQDGEEEAEGGNPMFQFADALLGLFATDETEGQGLVEYALIITFIAVVVIVAMVFLQGKISTLFSKVEGTPTPGKP